MKIQLLSDIHLEGGVPQWLTEFKPSGDVLVLTGDIVTPRSIELLPRYFGQIGVPVIYVPGNHEYYRGHYPYSKDDYYRICNNTTNMHFLDERSFQLDDVAFVCATLWSDPDVVDELRIQNGINDFRLIQGFTVQEMRAMNTRAKKYIEDAVKKFKQDGLKTVVVTHFAPSFKAQEPRFAGGYLGSYFYNRMDDFVERLDPDLWIYGHTHGNINFDIGRVPVITNQQGYFGESTNQTFRPNFVYDLTSKE